jgi:putative transposase
VGGRHPPSHERRSSAPLRGREDAATVQWLSNSGSISIALETAVHAERLEVVTTLVGSPESNGMSEAFVSTMRGGWVESAEPWSEAQVSAQVPQWIEGCNEVAPHSSLGMKSPREARAEPTRSAPLCVSHEREDGG